jgi:hypothetical protein
MSGRNAFAEKVELTHRGRLAGNAFYQEAYARCKNTPPTMIHPALRPGVEILNPAIPLPELSSTEVDLHLAQTRGTPSHHNITTMTTVPEGELNLGTTPDHSPVPTHRQGLEQRSEKRKHNNPPASDTDMSSHPEPPATSESDAVRTFVLDPTDMDTYTRTPKKSFLDRINKWTTRRNAALPVPGSPIEMSHAPDLPMAPKARAVLHHAPPIKGMLPRTPSKSKGLFSRRKSDMTDVKKQQEQSRAAFSLGNRTPANLTLQLSRPSDSQGRPAPSSSSNIFTRPRSHSVTNLNKSLPPPPPAKDTPPAEQANRAGSLAHHGIETPSKSGTHINASGRLSPDLVTRKNTHSPRASVVPGAMDAAAFADAKSRMDGLDIEGFALPDETRREAQPGDYTPSNYSRGGEEVLHNSLSRFSGGAASRMARNISAAHTFLPHSDRKSLEPTPEKPPAQTAEKPQPAHESGSDYGTINVMYPDLEKDHPHLFAPAKTSPAPQKKPQRRFFEELDNDETPLLQPDAYLPESVSPVRRGLEGSTKNPFAPFTVPVIRDVHHKYGRKEVADCSPMTHHSSAVPSPLQVDTGLEMLQPLTYKPTPRPRKQPPNLTKVQENDPADVAEAARPIAEPDRSQMKAPELPRPKDKMAVRGSPPTGVVGAGRDGTNVEPMKPSNTATRAKPLRPRANTTTATTTFATTKYDATAHAAAVASSSATGAATSARVVVPSQSAPADPSSSQEAPPLDFLGVEATLEKILGMLRERDETMRVLNYRTRSTNLRLEDRLTSTEKRIREASKINEVLRDMRSSREYDAAKTQLLKEQKAKERKEEKAKLKMRKKPPQPPQEPEPAAGPSQPRPRKKATSQSPPKRVTTQHAHEFYRQPTETPAAAAAAAPPTVAAAVSRRRRASASRSRTTRPPPLVAIDAAFNATRPAPSALSRTAPAAAAAAAAAAPPPPVSRDTAFVAPRPAPAPPARASASASGSGAPYLALLATVQRRDTEVQSLSVELDELRQQLRERNDRTFDPEQLFHGRRF